VRFLRIVYRVPAILCWGYLAFIITIWLVLFRAEAWWLATILMFAPRWVFTLPLLLLMLLALCRRSLRLIVVVLFAAIIAVVPVAGFNIPWANAFSARPKGTPFRVVTLNMHYAKRNATEVDGFIESTWPDVIAIQEWAGAKDTRFKSAAGWESHLTPKFFLATRHHIRRVVELDDRSRDPLSPAMWYELDTPDGVVYLFSLHAESSRAGISGTLADFRNGSEQVDENSETRRRQLESIARHTRGCEGAVIVAGDFNTPPESPIFTQVFGGYRDAFCAAGWGFGYSFLGAKTTVRIDHILVNPPWGVVDCWVGAKVGSPHRPVIADLVRLEP